MDFKSVSWTKPQDDHRVISTTMWDVTPLVWDRDNREPEGSQESQRQDPFHCESKLNSLPPEILLHVLKHLDMPGVKVARQVCMKWRDFIDNEIPLDVFVDDTDKGNSQFVHRVVKRKMYVRSYWKNLPSYFCLKKPREFEIMEVDGRVSPHFITKFIPRFDYLSELKIEGETLLRPMDIQRDFLLPNLKKLTINSPFAHETNINLNLPSIQTISAKNTLAILTHVRCPKIEALKIDGDVNQTTHPSQHVSAELILSDFFERYSSTLKLILVGESSILKSINNPEIMRVLPTQLRSIHLSFFGNQDRPLDEQITWYRLIQSQQQLEYLNVGALWFPPAQMMLRALPITIKHLSIYWNCDNEHELSLGCFSKLVNLERLELTFDGSLRQKFTNFHCLQSCTKLKVLVSEQGIISARDLEKIHLFCPNLEVLYIFRCGVPGLDWFLNSESPHAPFGINRVALLNMLTKMRNLEYLHIDAADFLGTTSNKMEMISWIRPIAELQVSAGFHIGQEPNYSDVCLL